MTQEKLKAAFMQGGEREASEVFNELIRGRCARPTSKLIIRKVARGFAAATLNLLRRCQHQIPRIIIPYRGWPPSRAGTAPKLIFASHMLSD